MAGGAEPDDPPWWLSALGVGGVPTAVEVAAIVRELLDQTPPAPCTAAGRAPGFAGVCPPASMLGRLAWRLAGLPFRPSAAGALAVWRALTAELRRRWDTRELGQFVRSFPQGPAGGGGGGSGGGVDLSACLLHQKLEMLAACTHWRMAAGALHAGTGADRAERAGFGELRHRAFFDPAFRCVSTVLIAFVFPCRSFADERRLRLEAREAAAGKRELMEEEARRAAAAAGSNSVGGGGGGAGGERASPRSDDEKEFGDAEGPDTAVRLGGAARLELELLGRSGEAMWAPRVQVERPAICDEAQHFLACFSFRADSWRVAGVLSWLRR